jgi:hypothetical protein
MLIKQLQYQNSDPVYDRYGKYSFGGFISVCINVKSKKSNISYKAPHTKESDQPVLPEKGSKELIEIIIGELKEIDDYENQYWAYKAK